jgi:hypothetical protein
MSASTWKISSDDNNAYLHLDTRGSCNGLDRVDLWSPQWDASNFIPISAQIAFMLGTLGLWPQPPGMRLLCQNITLVRLQVGRYPCRVNLTWPSY